MSYFQRLTSTVLMGRSAMTKSYRCWEYSWRPQTLPPTTVLYGDSTNLVGDPSLTDCPVKRSWRQSKTWISRRSQGWSIEAWPTFWRGSSSFSAWMTGYDHTWGPLQATKTSSFESKKHQRTSLTTGATSLVHGCTASNREHWSWFKFVP